MEYKKDIAHLRADQPAPVNHYDFHTFVIKKTKNLTTGLYMVTSFLSDNEPLKWKLRDRAIVLFSDISNVSKGSGAEVENVFAGFVCAIEETLSILEIATATRLISEMNFAILKKEYVSLKELIESDDNADKRLGRFVFPQNFFTEDKYADCGGTDGAILVNGASVSPEHTDKGHDNGQHDKKGYTYMLKSASRTYSPPTKKKTTAEESIGSRRDAILKLFKNSKDLMIKDITREITGCSEKTIQRELVALVSSDVLKKKGERRWSRYSLR